MLHYLTLCAICALILLTLYFLQADSFRWGLRRKLNRGVRVYFTYMNSRYYGASKYVNEEGLCKVIEERSGRVFFVPLQNLIIADNQNIQNQKTA